MKIDITRRQKLEFNIEVEGAKLSELHSRLLLKESNYCFLVDGTIEDSKIIFWTPIIKTEDSTFIGIVEVIIADRLLKVWEDILEIEHIPIVKISEQKVVAMISKANLITNLPISASTEVFIKCGPDGKKNKEI